MLVWNWIKLGPILGILGVAAYVCLLAIPFPPNAATVLACVFGLSLSGSAVGIYHFVSLNEKTVSLQIGTGALVIAGVLVLCMLLLQLSINEVMVPHLTALGDGEEAALLQPVWSGMNRIQLAFDIAWDIFIAIAILFLAWNMRTHPKVGHILGISGVIIAVILLALNLYTFPIPPAEAGYFDAGPFAGLWFLLMSLRILIALPWAKRELVSG